MTTTVPIATVTGDLIENGVDEARTQKNLSSTQGVSILHMSNLKKPLNNKQMSKKSSN